jgi:hypothetical protein
LIHSAIDEVQGEDALRHRWGASWTSVAYVWGLKMDGSTEVTPASSHENGLADVRDRIQSGEFAALALFDKTSPHWPNPVTWNKSDDPAAAQAIAMRIAIQGDVVGYPWGYEIVGGEPWESIVGGPWVDIVGGEPWVDIVGGGGMEKGGYLNMPDSSFDTPFDFNPSMHVGVGQHPSTWVKTPGGGGYDSRYVTPGPVTKSTSAPRDITLSPQWSAIRGLIQGAINSVVESDEIADMIAAHVLRYLAQQGLFAGGQMRPIADFLRSGDWSKIKGVIRRAVPQIVYGNEALVDAIARVFVQHARSRVSGDVVGDGFPWGYEIVGAAPPWGDIIGPQPWHDRLADTRFWSWTGYKPGQKLDPHDPHDAAMIPIWLEIHAEVVRESQPYVSGEPWQSIVGSEPWVSIVGQALDVLRKQAQVAAEEMPSRVIGVVRDARNQWVVKSFRDADVADDWFGRVIRDKSRFTYAAYFDKNDPMFPHPLNEEIGGAHAPAVPPPTIPRLVAEVP